MVLKFKFNMVRSVPTKMDHTPDSPCSAPFIRSRNQRVTVMKETRKVRTAHSVKYRPSKVCPNCRQYLCLLPDYDSEDLWGGRSLFLKKHEVGRLFYLYP